MRSDWLKFKSGTSVRGSVEALTDEFANKVGYSFALWLAAQLETTPDRLVIAVGRDSRTSGERLADALIQGITAADSDVLDCALCTTPAMFKAVADPSIHADGAVMITASHLGNDRNGFKFMTRQGGLHARDVEDILARAQQVKLPNRLVTQVDMLSLYAGSLKEMVRKRLDDDALKPLLGMHVVVDAGNGAGGFYARMLEELGADISGSLYLEPDGNFPGHAPDPGDPMALAALSKAVLDYQADLGVIFDADCDRAAIVDQCGQAIDKNRLIALTAAILLDEKPGLTFVTDSVTSPGLSSFINEWGGTHYRFKRGYRNVIDEAIRLNEEGIDCPLAMETSGHAAFRDNFFLDDGMYLVTYLICEALNRKREGQTLSALLEGLREPVESVEIRLPLLDEEEGPEELTEMVLSHTLANPEWQLAPDNREGVRILFNLDGQVNSAWLQLRLSVHDPVMPLNAESDIPGGVKRILSELYALIQNVETVDLTPLKAYLEK